MKNIALLTFLLLMIPQISISQILPFRRDRNDDDTAEIDTDSSIEDAVEEKGLKISADFRPIFDYFDLGERGGSTDDEVRLGGRLRIRGDWGITENFHFVSRIAGTCFTNDCDLEFVFESSTPANNGLAGGQFTFDELFLHWFHKNKFDIAVGRLQTRFVLRGGVFSKSLDRNNSNNVNVNWTDGIQTTYTTSKGWVSSFILQRNDDDGTGSITHRPLDFDDGMAHNTFFLGFENIRSWGPIVQRSFDISYLPSSLLKDGTPNARRVDYWGLVGRLALRWPQRSAGPRLRAGVEIGYAPETQTKVSGGLGSSGNADGFALDMVVSIMDFLPDHSIGIDYARTGAGWLLSPQFRPNEELFEIRYQWRPRRMRLWRTKRSPLLEARVRWREDLEQPVGTIQKRNEFDFYLRLTWEFIIKDF